MKCNDLHKSTNIITLQLALYEGFKVTVNPERRGCGFTSHHHSQISYIRSGHFIKQIIDCQEKSWLQERFRKEAVLSNEQK